MTPDGRLVHSRVVAGPGAALATALDREVSGYAVLEPQDSLLLDDGARCVLTLDDGVPVAAYHAGTGRGGADAVADVAAAGPCRVELYDDPEAPRADDPGDPVAPGVPADLLADDPELADRTRRRAPTDAVPEDAQGSLDAVEAFLADEETVAAIQERAREQAADRAAEWGLEDVVASDDP
ncbi:MAG: hypothetical protein ABEJ04_01615 [Halobacteriaceae archaeon]